MGRFGKVAALVVACSLGVQTISFAQTGVIGNTGDPYEGGTVPVHTNVTGCGTLNPSNNQYFLLTQNIGSNPSADCLTVNFPATSGYTIDLGGHTITGRIVWQSNLAWGVTIMNGSVLCSEKATGCLYLWSGDQPDRQMRLHHLTAKNSDNTSNNDVAIQVQWAITGSYLIGGVQQALRIDHTTTTTVSNPSSSFSANTYVVGDNVSGGISTEYDHNDVTCVDGAGACQGVVLYGVRSSYVHDNIFHLAVNPGGGTNRAVVFDAGANGSVAAYNQMTVGVNRAFRIRLSSNISIHDNTLLNILTASPYAAIHHADENNGAPVNDTTSIYGNTFQLSTGNGVMTADGTGLTIHDNTVTCVNAGCAGVGYFAMTQSFHSLTGTNMIVENTTLPSNWGSYNAVMVCGVAGNSNYTCSATSDKSSATVCNSGPVVGNGLITNQTPPCGPSSPLTITTASVPGGTVGTAYSKTFAASGGIAPYIWTISSGGLPVGLSLSSAGVLSGTPTIPATYQFYVQVKDAAGSMASKNFSITVASPPTITTASIPGGTAGVSYSTTFAASGGTIPYTWTISSGTLPAGLSLSSVGVLSGTPTTAATYSFGVQVKDAAGSAATKSFNITVAAGGTGGCSSIYGNCGDAYEGKGGPPANATPVSACGTLAPTSGQYYLVKSNIGSSATANCLTVSYAGSFTLDLGGHTVLGGIVVGTNHLSGTTIFHGTVTCAIISGCVYVEGYDTPTAQARLHHLTVNQSALGAMNVYATWEPKTTGTPVPAFKMDHIDGAYPGGQPTSGRNSFLYFTGPYVGLEAAYNSLIFPNNDSACQGIVAFEAPGSYVHNNFIQFPDPMNITGDSCRAILFDSEGKAGALGTGGNSTAAYNIIYVGKNRAIRVRAEIGDVIHDNNIYNIRLGGRLAAVHIGECDLETEKASAQVYSNYFEINDGNAVVATGSPNVSANIHDNTIGCKGGNCASAEYLAETDALFPGYSGGTMTVKNNTVSVLTSAGKAAVRVCGPGTNPFLLCSVNTSQTSATVCNSGTAVGQGSITLIKTSPCP